MARKPRDYEAEYARRKAVGRARGQTGPEFRGHKPPPGKTEAQARREREQAEKAAIGKLTSPERSTIRAFARERSEFTDGEMDPEEAIAGLLEWATKNGYEKFKAERNFIKNLGMQGMSMAEIEARSADGEGFPDARMYWYRRKEMMKGRAWTSRTPDQRERRRRRERRQRRAARRKAA